jgi:LPS-assembly protein
MKNNKFKFLICIILFKFFIVLPAKSIEPFEFDVTFLEILENGNIIKGSKGGSAFTNNRNTVIKAENFEYDKTLKILKANGNVEIIDLEKNITLIAPKINYLKNTNQIFTEGLTKINLENKYNFVSKDVLLNRDKMIISSKRKSKIFDNSNTIYEIDQFNFLIESKILKGNNVSIKFRYIKK